LTNQAILATMAIVNTRTLNPPRARDSRITRLLRSPVVDLLVGPHGIDRYLELIDPSLTIKDARAEVIAVRRQTYRSVTLTLKPNRAFGGFSAGQFVKVGIEIDGVRRTRTYSPANAADDGTLELTITLRDQGFVSQYLIEHARPGTVVHLSSAGAGSFTLPEELPERIALVSGGSGITPVLAQLRTLIADGYGGEIDFIHFARTQADWLYHRELQELAARHGRLRVVYRATREGDPRFAPGDTEATHVAVCGPPTLIDAVTELHPQARSETFTAPTLIVSGGATEGTLRFTKTGSTAQISTGTLLEQAEAAGLSPAYGCRMGICHSCTCRKAAGTVKNILTGEISAEEDEVIQICVSVPAGDVALEL
jgi:stearoyl-CoA 9-desaturase NADPH oxidoreductase